MISLLLDSSIEDNLLNWERKQEEKAGVLNVFTKINFLQCSTVPLLIAEEFHQI